MATRVEQHVQAPNADNVEERAPARDRYENQSVSDIPILEWIVGAVGFAIVGTLLAYLFYHAIAANQSPPDVAVKVVSVVQVRSSYLVTAQAHNHGGSTAAAVVIQGELRQGAELVEQSNTTLDYSPPNSQKQVGLFFSRDPRQFDLHVRALGYVEP